MLTLIHALIHAVFAFFLVYFFPGMLAVHALPLRPHWGALQRVLLAFVLSFWLLYVPGMLLARFSLLHFSSVISVLAIEVVLFSGIIFLRRERYSIDDNPGFDDQKARSTLDLPLSIALVAIAVFHLSEILSTAALRGGFFYLSEAKYIIEQHGIPKHVFHFGQQISPQVDKLGFDVVASIYLLLGPDKPELLAKVAYACSVLVGGAAAYGFFVSFTTPALAAAAAVLLYGNTIFGEVVTLRSFFIPESVSFIFLLTAFCFWEKPRHVLWCSFALAACALEHLEIALLGPLFLGVYAVLVAISKYDFSPLRRLLQVGVTSIALFLCGYLLLGTVPDFVESSVKKEKFEAYQGHDPTWEYITNGKSHLAFQAGPYFRSVGHLLQETLLGQGRAFSFSALALGTLFVLLFFAFRAFLSFCHGTSRKEVSGVIGVASVLVIGSILVLGYVTDRMFDVFIYQTEITRRLGPYLSLFGLMLTSEALQQVPWKQKLFQNLFIGIVLVCYVLSFPVLRALPSPFLVSASGGDALRWLRQVPQEGRILANIIGSGGFHVLANRVALLEGHQPFLRPKLLLETLSILDQAREFFRNPQGNQEFLQAHQIAYVAWVRGEVPEFGGPPLFPKGTTPLFPPETVTAEIGTNLLCFEKAFGHIDIYSICP